MSDILDLSKKELTTKIRLRDLAGNIVTLDPKKLLSISDSELSNDIQNISVESFTVQRAKDMAELDMQNAKQAIKVVSGQLYNKYIASPVLKQKNNGRKPTESQIKSAITATSGYNTLVQSYNKKNYVFMVLKDLSYDMQNKSNLLQTESSNQRAFQQIRGNNV